MGCRNSAPLDVLEDAPRAAGDPAIDALSVLDFAAFEERYARRHRARRYRNQEERLADIAALQQSLAAMEDFFENLVNQAQIYLEAMDPNNNAGAGPPPASDAAIASLIRSPLTEKQLALVLTKKCSICCEVYGQGEMALHLPCGHFYHNDCVEPWLHRHCTCPTCRFELPTDDADFEEGRMERMKSRKTTTPQEQQQQDSSSSSSQAETTWEETSSWGEEGVHLMQDFLAWSEDYHYQDDQQWMTSASNNDAAPCIVRLIDDERVDGYPTRAFRPFDVDEETRSRADADGPVFDRSSEDLETPRARNPRGRHVSDGDCCTETLVEGDNLDDTLVDVD